MCVSTKAVSLYKGHKNFLIFPLEYKKCPCHYLLPFVNWITLSSYTKLFLLITMPPFPQWTPADFLVLIISLYLRLTFKTITKRNSKMIFYNKFWHLLIWNVPANIIYWQSVCNVSKASKTQQFYYICIFLLTLSNIKVQN